MSAVNPAVLQMLDAAEKVVLLNPQVLVFELPADEVPYCRPEKIARDFNLIELAPAPYWKRWMSTG